MGKGGKKASLLRKGMEWAAAVLRGHRSLKVSFSMVVPEESITLPGVQTYDIGER